MKKAFIILLGLLILGAVIIGLVWFRQTRQASTTETANTNTSSVSLNQTSATDDRVLDERSCNQQQMFQPPPGQSDLSNITFYTYTSEDGVTFEKGAVFSKYGGAGVPSVTQGADGTLVAVFNWFPNYEEYPECYNKVMIQTSSDGGVTWDGPYGLYVEDFPENYQLPYDPTITTTADGKYRLFFTTHLLGFDTPFIYGTALSDDDLHFVYDGIAFASEGNDLVDGSATRVGETWYLLAPMAKQNGRALQATSSDGKTFTEITTNRPEDGMYWVGNLVNVDGTIRFYGSCAVPSGLIGLCYISSTDGDTWSEAVKTNLPPGDPAVTYTSAGQYLLIASEEKNTMPLPEDSTAKYQ
jgi:hypothetical protein